MFLQLVDKSGQVRIPRVNLAMGAGTVISPERARSQFEGAADFGALRCWGRSLPKMARLNSRTFMTILWPGFPGRFMFASCRVRTTRWRGRTRRATDCAGDSQRHLRWYRQTDSRLTSTETQTGLTICQVAKDATVSGRSFISTASNEGLGRVCAVCGLRIPKDANRESTDG